MFGVIAFMIGLIRFLKNGSPIALVFCLAVLPALYSDPQAILRKFSSSEAAKLQHAVDELAQLTAQSEDGS